ncbi:Cell surface glycoprotein 1 [Rhizoctonia solani]|uniref:Cell surface glycoprotein 1 n=1 Tax=Rhizoctonia solani TaxID=456999 RepID=A0A0K6FR44_9AGAM|nr:Cell surface glycoprotein 1 [Rhizoctonia solani]
MEPRKRANQAPEQEESNIKRVKHTIKALFRAEGSTGTGASFNPIPREDTLENEQSNSGFAADYDVNQSITNSTTEDNQQDILDASPRPRNLRVDASSTKRKGLKNLLKTGVLGPVTDALGPIKQVAEIFVECVDAYKVAEETKVEHDELVARLEGLFEDLVGHLQDGCSQPMTASMNRLCKSIQEELETMKDANGKSTGSRLLATNDKADEILACYRRVEGYLERLSLNANLSMWKIVHEQATNYQSDRMFSLIDRLPSVLPARYNSAEGGAWKRRECTPDTRVQEISKILGWVRNKGEGTVYWLNGMAGTGKTTIAYSVCAGLDSGHMLGASFFCSRLQEECRNVNKIIPSIAYQLARFSRPFHHALCNALEKDPDVHGRILQTQFNTLIKDPMLQVQHTFPEELTVVIDALDECEDKETTRRMLEVLVNESTNLPIRFVLSSRPEPEIRDEMTEQVKSRLVLHELNKDDVRVDIETYLRAELVRMKPSEEQLAALVQKAGILFIYAATAVRYIGYDNFRRNPHARLGNLLDAQRNQKTKKNEEIDELYTIVLDAALDDQGLEDEERSDIRQILHTVICARGPLTVSGLSELLQIHDNDRVRAALRPLWSVLHIVGVDELVTTLHASFPDFILDSSRSHAHYCDSEAHHRTLAEHCLERIEREQPRLNICGLESSYLPDDRVPNIEKRVSTTISSDQLYACRYWADHVQDGRCALTLVEKLRNFLCTRLLLWMEVLNLNKQIKTGIECMKLVIEWCKQLEDDRELVELANDAQRFVETFASNPVSQSTPHIYVSMLAFWPRDAPVAKHYAQSTCAPVEAEGTGLDWRQSAHISTWTFKAGIAEIAVSQDGRYVALAIEKEVVVVDSSTGQIVLGPLYGLPERVGSIMFSPDQNRILAASKSSYNSHTAIVIGWDTRTGDRVLGPLELHGNTGGIDDLMFSPDCACIAISYHGPKLSGNDPTSYEVLTSYEVPTLRLWNTKNGVMLRRWETTDKCVVIAFALDGTLVAAGCYRSLQVWNTQTGQTFLGPLETRSIEYIAFSPDASRIIHSEGALNLYVRNSQSGDILHDLSGIYETIAGLRGIRYSPDGTCIVGVLDDITPGAIRVWGAIDYQTILGPLKGHTGDISSIVFSPDGSRIISGCSNGLVCTWDAHQRNLPSNSTNTVSIDIVSAKFSSDGMRFVTGSKGGLLHIWDSYTGELSVGPIRAHNGKIVAVDFWNDRVVSGSKDGTVSVWNALSGEVALASVTSGLNKTVTAVAYSPNGNLIVTASCFKSDLGVEVNLWDAHAGTRVLGPLKDARGYIPTIQFSPDGTRIAGITRSFRRSRSLTVVWDTSDGREVSEPYESRIEAVSISYSPNGAFIALGHENKTITLWDAYTRTEALKQLTGHSSRVDSVYFSPDSTRIVSSTYQQIWIWDVQTGQVLFELPHGHEQDIKSVAYSPDGTRILSLSKDMSVRIHDARTNQERALSWAATEYGDWTMNKDGWVVDDQSRLLAWVPPDLRGALLRSRTQVAIAPWGDDSDEDDGPTASNGPEVVEPSKRPTLQDMATSRKSVPPRRGATPKLSLMTEASRRVTQPPEEVDAVSIPLPASPEDKRRIRELEAELRRLREELAKTDQAPPAVSSSALLPPQEKGKSDGELDEDGEGPRSDLDRALCMMRAGLKTTAQTPAAGPKISTGKTPTVPMESMTAFLEEMKTVKLKSRVGPTPKASAIKVEVEEDDGDDDVGSNTFAFRRQRGPPISPRALRATSSLNSNGSSPGTLSFPVKLRKTDSGAALFGRRPKRPSMSGANASAPFSLPGAKRKRPEAEPQAAIRSVSVDATTERELPTPSLCSDTTELEVEERALRTPPGESRPTKESGPQAGVKSDGGSTAKPGAGTSSKANVLPADISKNLPSRQKAVPDRVEKPRSKSKPTSPLEDTRPAPGDKLPSATRDQSAPVPEDTSVAPGSKTMATPGEKSIRAAASKAGAGRRRFVPVFAVPPPPPTTSATTPAPSAAETSTGSAHSESSSSKTRDRPNVDTNVRASTPARKTSLSKITPSSPLPRPDFSAKKPRAPRLLTPQRREVIVIDDSDEEESPKSAGSRRARRRPGLNDSDSDDPLAFTSTPARGSKATRSTQPEWDIDSGVMQGLSFRSLFPNSDDDELEGDVYTGVGTQSKTGGFLKGGGAGGRAVWAGAGTVSGADEPVDKSGSISRRR